MRARIYPTAASACARILCVALALLALLPCSVAGADAADGALRVKLARLGAPSEIVLVADCDYTIEEEPALRIPAGTQFTLSAAADRLILSTDSDGVKLGASARLVREGDSHAGLLFLSPALSNRFCGDLCLSASSGVISATLRIPVEDYLYGVVGYELPPSGGLEALKAQAIVARTYALRQKAARSGASYDLSDSGEALSFRGYNSASEYDDAMRAVDETRGQVLCYGDSLAACYFCESNGGQTESSAHALEESLPYSVVMDDPYDLEGGGTGKTATLRRDATGLATELTDALTEGVAAQLRAKGIDAAAQIASIEDIQPAAPRFDAPSRLYRALDFTLSVNVQSLPTEVTVRVPTYGGLEDWYGLSLNDQDNETVWVGHTNREFTVTFRRKGHGVGMSQRGALAMAEKGLPCETILDYYYPGTQLKTMDPEGASQGDAPIPGGDGATEPIATARLGQKARLYERADADSSALTTLPAGATVSIYAVQGEWAAIHSGDLRGFIRSEALTSFTLVGVAATQVQDETFAQIRKGPVELLQLPVDTAMVLETLPDSASVRLDAYTDQWAMVTAPSGVEGFIPRSALTLQTGDGGVSGEITVAQEDLYGLLTEEAGLYVNTDDSVSPRQVLERGSYVQILAYNSAWAYVRTQTQESGYVKAGCLSAVRQAAPLPEQEPAESEPDAPEGGVTVVRGRAYRYVRVDSLPLYESYSADSPVLMTLKAGDRVQLGAYNQEWACVRVDGVTGFARLDGLAEDAPHTPQSGDEITFVEGEQYATVLADDTPLYPTYSEQDAPLTLLEPGTEVRLGAYNQEWACVRVDGMTGFVRLEALSPIDANP